MQGHDEEGQDERRRRQHAAHPVGQPLLHRVELAGGQLFDVLRAQCEPAEEGEQGEAEDQDGVVAERAAAVGEQSRAGVEQQRPQDGPADDE
ncbi:hypothetical protein [Streptomyces sp. NPDC059708]|uniref:hypothetical protein n=1 Tax=Streptomyces sp. NPDC059708 TaxID=3346916 RepID=UPI0036BB3E07